MKQQTIKTIVDCDYLVYLSNNNNPVGFELTADERQALSIRYKAKDDYTEPTIPEQAVFVMEVFGVSTTIVWLFNEDDQTGEMLFYKPSMLRLAKEVVDNLDMAVEILEYEPETGASKHTRKEAAEKNLPVPIETAEKVMDDMREAHLNEIINRLPFPNWMKIYWKSPMWMKIWNKRKDLQELMAAYAEGENLKEGVGR